MAATMRAMTVAPRAAAAPKTVRSAKRGASKAFRSAPVAPRSARMAPRAAAGDVDAETGISKMREGIKEASAENALTPRFYTTDFDEMEQLFSTEINPNLDQAGPYNQPRGPFSTHTALVYPPAELRGGRPDGRRASRARRTTLRGRTPTALPGAITAVCYACPDCGYNQKNNIVPAVAIVPVFAPETSRHLEGRWSQATTGVTCTALARGGAGGDPAGVPRGLQPEALCAQRLLQEGRGFHSPTFRLNVSACCGKGGAFRGCPGDM